MSFLRSLISTLNDEIDTNLCEKNACYYSLTQPGLLKNGKRQPFEPGEKDARVIIPTDIHPLQVYHRLLGVDSAAQESLGDNYLYQITFNLRLYGIAILDKIDAGCFAGHDDISLSVWSAIPKSGSWIASGMKGILFRVGRLNTDSRGILSAEYSGLDEGRINGMSVGAFSVDYTVSGRLCSDLCDVGDVIFNE